MKQHLKTLKILEKTSSTNDKIELLKEFLQDETFKKICQFAIDSRYTFKIKSIEASPMSKSSTIEEIFALLEEFSDSRGVSLEEKKKLARLCSTPSKVNVVNRILRKNLGCGVSGKALNKAMPNTIPIFPYQRCSTIEHINRIKFPAMLQVKMDGLFTNVFSDKVLSRNGKPFKFKSKELYEALKDLSTCASGMVFLGEGLVRKPNTCNFEDRSTGNGILNKAIKGTISEEESNRICFTFWDMVPEKSWLEGKSYHIPYKERFENLQNVLNKYGYVGDRFYSACSCEVNSVDEAVEQTNKWIQEDKEEGSIVKNFDSIWQNSTSRSMIKIKDEKTCDLVIVDWEYGKKGGKFECDLGGFVCESKDGKLEVTVGGGLSEKFRRQGETMNNQMIGSIVEVTYNAVIDNKKSSTKSLFLPRFKDNFLRLDKDEADTLKRILSI